ncbi:uncharacterized protein LOC113275379 isoform X1 [Papaver somniferum]|uniref:uncharacterized protein LOC113275379 isoform X1 n=2 Tax=Papaver somniferum TaxID=3469 RepID=UPI000E6F9145|nr:uncharacterized protein LOC113275379 isoform X1 [Papaver somniferum]XP_026380649.1 uncharacterized protein LOC113275379 isoform X1 [Papaver somniferum]
MTAVVGRSTNMLETLVKEGAFSWILGNKNSFDEDFEEMSKSPSSRKNWLPELSSKANLVVRRCSRLLDKSLDELQECFDAGASDPVKHTSCRARNFLEYCCFQTLSLSTQVNDSHLGDKKFRRLTYDMMLAWEAPAATSQPSINVDEEGTVGREAFSRITPAVPTISDVITCENLFDFLTTSTGGRLRFSVYEKYLGALERAIRKMKTQTESSHLSLLRSHREERILELDGTVTTQPVLEHFGVSTWPGRLTLTDHALYFEAHRMVSFEKAKTYELSEDLKQVVKPELTGPWGARLFDKGVMYKSVSLPEPIVMEFPELKGHFRRDYWLAAIREILYAHKFIRKFNVEGIDRDEILLKAVIGILRVQAVLEITTTKPLRTETLLMFNECDRLPGGDLILETLATTMSTSQELDRENHLNAENTTNSISTLTMVSNCVFGAAVPDKPRLFVGEIVVGEMTPLERAVSDSRNSFKKVELAQATVDGVKVEGLDTNLAVMKELLFPVLELGKYLNFLASWDDSVQSFAFCSLFTFVVCRGWLPHVFALLLLFIAIFMLLTRWSNQGSPVDEVKVTAPPSMNTMEQLLAVQNAISQVEAFIQDGNISLLKLRALFLSVSPQASDKLALALVLLALTSALIPSKYIFLLVVLESNTRYSPLRKPSTERWKRRLREWWYSIPAAPVVLARPPEDQQKKRK